MATALNCVTGANGRPSTEDGPAVVGPLKQAATCAGGVDALVGRDIRSVGILRIDHDRVRGSFGEFDVSSYQCAPPSVVR